VGQIRAKSECQVHSYLNDPKSTAEYFRDGWFYPGDLGALDEQNGLFLHGRVSEVINMGGTKVAPSTIEEALVGIPGVAELAVFSIGTVDAGEHPGVAVVASGEVSDEDLHGRYRKAFPGLPPLTVHRVEKIPRNEMGKVLRAELTATYGRGPNDLLH
jgi:acyl-CoA synthetase (AMP-forming)/AMP-acid ligase II